MKRTKHRLIFHLAAFGICLLSALPGADAQPRSDVIKDRDGNSYPVKIMPDNKKWMTANLNLRVPGSYCYENAEQKCGEYGRLYTWTIAQEVCRSLGEGWRLPANDEWRQLGKSFGGVRDDSDDGGKAAYQALITGGTSGFNITYGGGRDPSGNYARGGDHGFYWTATESDSAHAWFYNFGRNGKIMNRHHDGEKTEAFSVRCISDR
ncbi:FISUMP domain-containing protein [Chitinophaga sp. YIM B06452]|uniref:FISUMP domain-containing protein n=1 Tax=Chitinophaga sp. YIM B06452 TaxID=3082158 RepID=UPI0031FF1E77